MPQPHGDPLADALLFLAAFHGRALSRDALLSGLPIEDDRLSPQLFSRAVQRAGFEVEAVKRPLAEIPGLVLPAVLIMADRTCRILLSIDTDLKKATVCDPSQNQGNAREVASFAALDANYLGYAFFARPSAAADPRKSVV